VKTEMALQLKKSISKESLHESANLKSRVQRRSTLNLLNPELIGQPLKKKMKRCETINLSGGLNLWGLKESRDVSVEEHF